ncbi:unnamed protein product, partial [Ascophyllum nodosum]
MAASAEGRGLGLDVLLLFLNNAVDGQEWYASIKPLHLVCSELCIACRNRNLLTWHVGLTGDKPRNIWLRPRRGAVFRTWHRRPRLPPARIRAATWELPARYIPRRRNRRVFTWASKVIKPRRSLLTSWLRLEVDKVWFSGHLEQLTFGGEFNNAIDCVSWPGTLRQLTFGGNFNQPITDVTWPGTLRQLTFGRNFNQPITDVTWPGTLRQLTFGRNFNQ